MLKLSRFLRDEKGLTTIEWVSICAVVLIAAVAISSMVLSGADDLGTAVTDKMSAAADDVE
jgi:Flp pilus assembly pilin Flp